VPLDDRLNTELRQLAPSDPSGAFERVVEKRVRRGIARRLQSVALVVIVLLGTSASFYGLSRVFLVSDRGPVASPPVTNGAIAFERSAEGKMNGSHIWMVMPDGTGERQLTFGEDAIDRWPAWSPDGSEISFVRLGFAGTDAGDHRLMAMDLADEQVRHVTPPGIGAARPDWSPDGSRIAFAGVMGETPENGIYVVNEDGTDLHQVTGPSFFAPDNPEWSPDGSRIAFSGNLDESRFRWDVYVMNPDGSGLRDLTQTPDEERSDWLIGWLPNGNLLISEGPSQIASGPGLPLQTARWLEITDSGDVVRVIYEGPANTSAERQGPSLSPDGRFVVFDSPDEGGNTIRYSDLETGDVTEVATRGSTPAWQPIPVDGRGPDVPLGSGLGSIAVTWYRGFPDPEHDLALVSTNDGAVTPLTFGTQVDSEAAWSPDGSTIAFWSVPHGGPPGTGIYTVPAAGGEPTLLLETDLSIWSISWSPQGDRIAFVGVNPVDGSQSDMPMAVYVMASDGSGLRQLTSDGQVMDAAWSPDGTRLAITRSYAVGERRTGNDIYVLKLATGEEQRLTNDGTAWKPSWSPDGTRIAFTSNETGAIRDSDLYVISADGSGRTRLTDTPEIEEDTAWAPDGSAIAVTRLGLEEPRSCDLVLVSPDGSTERVLVVGPVQGSCAISLSWQPAG
jgi:Tol biopolymer transport system component